MDAITETLTFEIDERNFGTIMISFENAFSIYIFEEKPRIGTFGISIPGTSIVPASTLYITGSKNENFVRMMGERLAIQLQKLVLISLSLEEIENELLLKIMHKIETNLPKQKKRKSK